MDKMKLPVQRFEAQFAAGSADSERKSVTCTWQTGAQMDRYGWQGRFQLTLSMDQKHVRMGRLESGSAPFLNNHSSYDIKGVLGVIENAWIKNGTGQADVRFSQRADVQPVFDDIQAGIIRNVSVGASIHKLKDITPPKKNEGDAEPMKQYLAVDWEPMEISIVPIGADPGARFSEQSLQTLDCEVEGEAEVVADATRATAQKEKQMDPITITAGQEQIQPVVVPTAVAPQAPVDINAVKLAARQEERERIAGIKERCSVFGLPEVFAQSLIDRNVSLSDAADAIFAEKKKAEPVITGPTGAVQVTRDAKETKCGAVVNALMHRYDPQHNELREDARQFRGMSLLRIAEDFVLARGINVSGLGRDTLAARALERENFATGYEGVSDFPSILADVANKTLRQAYQQTERTFVPLFRQVTAVDFKNLNRSQLGEAPQLKQVGPSGDFTYGSMGDAKETYKLATYGRIIALNRQTIVNDDLDAFSRIPAGFGMQAANLESDTVWGIVTANAALADTVALFHATHTNLVTAAAAAPDVAQLSAMRKLLRQMKGIDTKTLLNIRGKYLVVPSALETNVEQLVAQNIPLVPVTSGTSVPQWFRSLTPVVEPRLDAASATAYYLFADYGQIDTIEYAYLEGQDGVYIETRMGFNVDGIEIKARLDFAAKAIDYRGMVKNAGA